MAFFQSIILPACAVRWRRVPPDVQGVHAENLDLEQFLHGAADLQLWGATISDDGVVIILLAGVPFRSAGRF